MRYMAVIHMSQIFKAIVNLPSWITVRHTRTQTHTDIRRHTGMLTYTDKDTDTQTRTYTDGHTQSDYFI